MALIYHITECQQWENAGQSGEYRTDSLETQKFIHFSTVEQVLKVANAIYRGQSGLVLLTVDSAKLTAELKYEPPDPAVPAVHEGEEVFPHLYGALNMDAVVSVVDFPPQADGSFVLPEGL